MTAETPKFTNQDGKGEAIKHTAESVNANISSPADADLIVAGLNDPVKKFLLDALKKAKEKTSVIEVEYQYGNNKAEKININFDKKL